MKQKMLILIFLLAIAFIIILSIIFIQNSGKRTIKNDEKNNEKNNLNTNISSKNINKVKEENMDTIHEIVLLNLQIVS